MHPHHFYQKLMQGNIISFNAKKIFINNQRIVSTKIHERSYWHGILLSVNTSPCHIYKLFFKDFDSFIILVYPISQISFPSLFTRFVSHNPIIRHNFIILPSKLQHEYLWLYISTKSGSIFKTITEIHRKEIIRMELLNWRDQTDQDSFEQ